MPAHSQSDSDAPTRSVPSRSSSTSGAVAKPPGAQIRYVSTTAKPGQQPLLTRRILLFLSRRAGASQVAKPNSTRAAGAGGSSNTMLKLYTDDSVGLRVYVFLFSFSPLPMLTMPLSTVTPSSSSSSPSPLLHPYSSFISPPKSSAPLQNKKDRERSTPGTMHPLADGKRCYSCESYLQWGLFGSFPNLYTSHELGPSIVFLFFSVCVPVGLSYEIYSSTTLDPITPVGCVMRQFRHQIAFWPPKRRARCFARKKK